VQQILADLAALQGKLHLLSQPSVLDDLELTGERRQEVEKLAHDMDVQRAEFFKGSRAMTPSQRRQRFIKLARAHETEAEKVLSPDQLHRLRQIDLQLQGLRAFEDAGVSAALKLTLAQKERLRAIQDEASSGAPPGQAGRGEPLNELAPSSVVVAKFSKEVLTGEQRRHWQELTGAPFKGTIQLRSGRPQHHGPPS
jgi:hypothetical protein